MRFVIVTTLLLFSLLSFAQDYSKDTTVARIEKLSSEKAKAKAYNDASKDAWLQGELQNALEYSKRGLTIAKRNNYQSIQSELYNNRGVTYDYLSDYPAALKNYFAGLAIQEKVNDPKLKASILGNIGLIYSNQEQWKRSLKYHNRALKLSESINDRHGVSIALNNAAIVYNAIGQFEKAAEYYIKCIEIDSLVNDTVGLGDDYNNIALVYMGWKDYDVSIDYLQRALEIRTSTNNIIGLAKTNSNIGEVHFSKEEYDTARVYFKKAIQFAQEANDRESLKYIYDFLAKNEEKAGDTISAYRYYKLFITYRDSIDNSTIARKQTELELNYQFNKEKEVARAKQEEKDRQYNIILIAISSGLVLILLFSILFFLKWKQTQAQQIIIQEKNELVQRKNNEIMASISYAKRIQKAILPSTSTLEEAFPNNSVLYLPKDIVSGDFYWMDEIDSTQFLAVADCTGHGVPGAMMSVVCHNALNRAVHEFGKKSSSEILNKTRELVIEEMTQQDESVADGMDISLCAFDKKSNMLNWSGANNPLWIYRKQTKTMEQIKADKQPIGNHQNPVPFTEYELELQRGDRIYLFSDGYQDQFGGPKGKKVMRKGLKNAILDSAEQPIDEQRTFLHSNFISWKNDLEQVDDVCVICIERIS